MLHYCIILTCIYEIRLHIYIHIMYIYIIYIYIYLYIYIFIYSQKTLMIEKTEDYLSHYYNHCFINWLKSLQEIT